MSMKKIQIPTPPKLNVMYLDENGEWKTGDIVAELWPGEKYNEKTGMIEREEE